jgi:hypothetical protein
MPYCSFCGKQCANDPGLERHIANAPECKKASSEIFGQYANTIWDDIPAIPNNMEQQPDAPADFPVLPDFHLEEDIHLDDDFQIAEEALNDDEFNLHQQFPPPPPPHDEPQPHSQQAAVEPEVPSNEEIKDGGRYIENFPEEYLAGATWGRGKPLFESLDEERREEGGSHWAPFEDEDEWQLAEWLIRNVGQKQTDNFLRLPIVSLSFALSENIFNQLKDSKTNTTDLRQ